MDPYGIKFVNDDGVTQIDSTYPVLQVLTSGTIAANVVYTFPKPITTVEQPWIFIKPTAGNPWLLGIALNGGPGYWTGFKIQSCADNYFNHGLAGRNYGTWQFVIAAWQVAKSPERYGIRVWDESSQLLWDTGWRTMNLRSLFNNWSYGYRHDNGGWYYVVHTQSIPDDCLMTPTNDNYFLGNPFCYEEQMSAGSVYYRRKVGGWFSTGLTHIAQTDNKNQGDSLFPGIIGRLSP